MMEAGLPEEEGQGLEKGLEVVVEVYGIIIPQRDVTKHLQQQGRRLFIYLLVNLIKPHSPDD